MAPSRTGTSRIVGAQLSMTVKSTEASERLAVGLLISSPGSASQAVSDATSGSAPSTGGSGCSTGGGGSSSSATVTVAEPLPV